uniref:Uncharacterized protein n=1 Tax=Aplanochytrium stocchinoi TaxID=215587 RepID=A0A7S3PQ38_9STRA|mmetsp:Transcript_3703/g.4358  ORF Transcript_3703/g.4358 Transcript_3703/m.4358 type:complete len:265 (-) Transcript_3703:199-993(-)|eukprot:CAMPEP_0204830352 /NCGR_PEP_ID=MMETSP1346-20131115/8487_1 /ASSEMBLY_ACC=CAM_ASM_000771 /TAXON_ID=215587 /ORGANISM="Aplanochytrium stocchinoi, Strain GSBS06" /LENGTH=264 /DNA_ID=CAMNT_0051960537 /DNA_START=138 /DNA_END=932 /DNA_ORIENTATION=-
MCRPTNVQVNLGHECQPLCTGTQYKNAAQLNLGVNIYPARHVEPLKEKSSMAISQYSGFDIELETKDDEEKQVVPPRPMHGECWETRLWDSLYSKDYEREKQIKPTPLESDIRILLAQGKSPSNLRRIVKLVTTGEKEAPILLSRPRIKPAPSFAKSEPELSLPLYAQVDTELTHDPVASTVPVSYNDAAIQKPSTESCVQRNLVEYFLQTVAAKNRNLHFQQNKSSSSNIGSRGSKLCKYAQRRSFKFMKSTSNKYRHIQECM